MWKNDKMEGDGTYTWSEGSKYIGMWKNDKRKVMVFTFPDGGKYIGMFKNDLRHGEGMMTYPNGSEYIGGGKIINTKVKEQCILQMVINMLECGK